MSFASNNPPFGMGPGFTVPNTVQNSASTSAGATPLGQPGTLGSGFPTQPTLLGQPQQNQPNPLFGGQNQQPQASTSFLGQPLASAQTGAATTSNPFLSAPTNTQSGGGGFGSSTSGTGLFGQSQPQQNTGLGGFSFNQPQNPQQQQQSGGGGFGSSLGSFSFNQPQQNQQQQQQQQQQTSGGLFGSSFVNPQQKPAAFAPAQSTAPPAPSGPPPFTKSTKFNDLPDNVKKTFEDIEAHIQGRVQISNDLKQRKVGDEATKGQDHIRGVHKDLINSITVLQNDVFATRDLTAKVDQSVQDTIVATHIVDGFRNPQQHGAYLRNHATFPLEFFTRITEEMRKRLQGYKATIEQIERKLASSAQQAQYTPQALSTTLEAQHATFISLANKTASLDADLQKLKIVYTQLWRAKTGSMRDPFNELDRGSGGEFGLDRL